MNSIVISFFITTLAGLSTMFGIFPIFLSNYKEEKILPAALLFASGVMLTISFLSLIPEGFTLFFQNVLIIPSILFTAIFVVLGIGFSARISRKIEEKLSSNYLYRLGIITVIALIFHNLPEGITTFLSSHHDLSLGITLSLGIALHNIPEGISISIPIYYATNSKFKAIFYTFISAISEPFGALLTYLFLSNYINDRIMGFLFGIIAGIMIHISIYELLPTSKSYNKLSITYLFFILGVLLMIINHFVF